MLSIYPVFWVTYIAVSLCFLVFGKTIKMGDNPAIILMSVFGMDGYLYSMYKTYYLIGEWFLGFILVLYAIYPLIRIVYLKSKIMMLCASILVALISVNFNDWIYSHSFFWNFNAMWNPTARLPEFVFGMIFFDYIRGNDKKAFYALIVSIAVISVSTFSDVGFFDGLYSTPVLCASFSAVASIYELVKKPSLIVRLVSMLSAYSFIAFLVHHRIIFYIMSSDIIKSISVFNFLYLFISTSLLSFLSAAILSPVCERLKSAIN